MKRIAIFGSTGSIGTQTLELLEKHSDQFEVLALSGNRKSELLNQQKAKWKLTDERVHQGPLEPQVMKALMDGADMVLNALPGFVGLDLSIEAIRAGKILLSANKESLAIAGQFLKEMAQEYGAEIRPLDSEASAVWQLLNEYAQKPIERITLTCSGGPFRGKKATELSEVTVADALKHPTWSMGPKVSLDSATLINKVLEVYEVHHLFGTALDKIDIVVHPQSLVHAMVHTQTGATRMHWAPHDMKVFLKHALLYPEKTSWPEVEMGTLSRHDLSFQELDEETFRPIKWLNYHRGNPNFPLALNALNDIAVERFFKGELSFLGIYEFIEAELPKYLWQNPPKTLEEVIQKHHQIRS